MRVFVTGATGFVGSAVVRHLIGAGHEVSGLARSDAAATALGAAGVEPVRGDLTDAESLSAGAKASDAVIHCAFIHDFANFAASAAVDRQAIEVLGNALAGTGRAFIVTSGIGLVSVAELRTEDHGAATEGHGALRGAAEGMALALAQRDVRVSLMRLPPSVHGDGDHGFVPALIDIARKKGVAGYVGTGENRWSAIHRDDAARAYLLALERGVAGVRYHAVAEQGVAFRDIAAIIGRKLGVPAVSVPESEVAGHFGWIANFARMDMAASSRWTSASLGWHPTGRGLLEDMMLGTYFDD